MYILQPNLRPLWLLSDTWVWMRVIVWVTMKGTGTVPTSDPR